MIGVSGGRVTGNLKLLDEYLDRYEQLSQEDREVVRQRIHQLQDAIEKTPKSLRWKMRAILVKRLSGIRMWKN
jgi:hypothetical protein